VYGWIKIFNNRAEEMVLDEDILAGEGSWSKGELDDLYGVVILSAGKKARLIIPDTEWHQFDKFSMTVAPGKYRPNRTHQVVQALIKPHHVGKVVELNTDKKLTARSARVIDKDKRSDRFFFFNIRERHIGQWLSLAVEKDSSVKIGFCKRGQLPR